MILDTSFVIAAEREARRKKPGPADAFLTRYADREMAITFTVSGELACVRSAASRTTWGLLVRPYRILPWEPAISWQYGEIFRDLSDRGELIGSNDLWIAATARFHNQPIVTANSREFRRVKGLEVIDFTE